MNSLSHPHDVRQRPLCGKRCNYVNMISNTVDEQGMGIQLPEYPSHVRKEPGFDLGGDERITVLCAKNQMRVYLDVGMCHHCLLILPPQLGLCECDFLLLLPSLRDGQWSARPLRDLSGRSVLAGAIWACNQVDIGSSSRKGRRGCTVFYRHREKPDGLA